MSTTIPTTELVGLLTDTIPFALDDPEWPEHFCVRLLWDGELLHTQAYDGTHLGWSRWSPDDAPDTDAQESLIDQWGGDDPPWSIVISLADAKGLAKLYKVNDKLAYTPLQVSGERGDLRIVRNKTRGLMAISTTVEPAEVTFPDLDAFLAKTGRPKAVSTVAFTAACLAHFAEVRPRGPMLVTFTGPTSAALVTIGDRFTGAIAQLRTAAERDLKAAA